MYKKIMVPLDGSELAECILSHVDGFVTDCRVETIVFVMVVEPTDYTPLGRVANTEHYENMKKNIDIMEEERKSSAARYLEEVVSRVKQDEVEYKTNVIVGKVAENIVDYADTNEIDLILIATHGRSGINRWARGSVADKVLHSSSAPVLMVRADGKTSGEKV